MKNNKPLDKATFLICALIISFTGVAQKNDIPLIRWPAVAGVNYPAEPEALLKTLQGFYAQADAPDVPSKLVAVIASAAPYGLAGSTSAHAFKSLQPGQYERVILLAPSHGPLFENCSVPAVDVFITPLGPVPLDAPAVRYLLYSPMFHAHQLRYQKGRPSEQIHEYEFAVESLLPYLQERLLEFQLVPVLFGDLRNPQGRVNENTVATVADAIRPLVNDRTLIVVASSFTHYGTEYGSEPVEGNLEDHIARLDRQAFETILAADVNGFRNYLENSRNFIDGSVCIQVLLKLLPAQAQSRILAYETSMKKTGEKDRSVSYAAFVFHDASKPALTPQPDKVRPLVMGRPEKIMRPENSESADQNATPAAPISLESQTPEQEEQATP